MKQKKLFFMGMIILLISLLSFSVHGEVEDPLLANLWQVWTLDSIDANNQTAEHFSGSLATYESHTGAAFTAPELATIHKGVGGLNFSANQVTRLNMPSSLIRTGTVDRCLSIWVQFNSFEEVENQILSMGSASANQEIGVFDNGTNALHWDVFGSSFNTGFIPTAGSMFLYTMSYYDINNSMEFYVNESLQSTTTFALNTGGSTNYLAMRRDNTREGNFLLDDYRVYNTTCGQEQVTYLYNGGVGRDITEAVVPPNGPPTVDISSPANGSSHDMSVTITWNSTDEENTFTQSVVMSNASGTVFSNTSLASTVTDQVIDISSLANGTYTVVVNATETNGTDFFSGTDSVSILVANEGTITNPVPVVTITDPANATVTVSDYDRDLGLATVWNIVDNNTLSINYSLSNASGTLKQSVSTVYPYIVGASFDLVNISNGTYTVSVIATETNGTDFFQGSDSYVLNIGFAGVATTIELCPAGQVSSTEWTTTALDGGISLIGFVIIILVLVSFIAGMRRGGK